MKKIESDALVLVNRILGLGGGSGQPDSSLDESTVSMVLNINDALRRGRAGGVDGGLFYSVFLNDHSAAGAETSTADPYDPSGLVPTIGAYPTPVPRGFDVWYIGGSLDRSAGVGTLGGGVVFLSPTAQQQGFGVDEAGAAVVVNPGISLIRWTGLDASITGVSRGIVDGAGGFFARPILRLARGVTISFKTEAVTAAAIFRHTAFFGVFPEGLGQDIAQ